MKKLLIFLGILVMSLLTFTSFAQLTINQSFTPTTNLKVGDTLSVKYTIDKGTTTPRYFWLRYQFNNKALSYVSTVFSQGSSVQTFYTTHKSKMALLNSKNSVQSFYDNTSLMVRKLISRNSKRLFKELKESKELVKLLSQSTQRELNDAEQKQMQEQLLDLLKSIPSLAIFLLPGGAILLPLFVKFIPKILPSAFDDNRIND